MVRSLAASTRRPLAQVSISVKKTTPITSGNQAPCRILLMLAAKKGTSTSKKRPASGAAHIKGQCHCLRVTTKNNIVLMIIVEVTANPYAAASLLED